MPAVNGNVYDDGGGGEVGPEVRTRPGTGGKGKKRTVEKTYQKVTQLEHILLRPDTYIGSVEKVTENMWVYDSEAERFTHRDVTYVPGLYKIFDEILVNAADNKQRDPKMDVIKIEIDQENNQISIFNNGQGIPVVIHKEQKMFVPTMIFGHLLTSSNYTDTDKKVTGGRNGYGAKLCNIFSTKFSVETANMEYRKSFKQTWGSNMSKTSEPKIKEFSGSEFTKVTFSPDLSKFGMTTLDSDIVSLMSRRAFDIAASVHGVKVFLNGKKVPVKNFKDYVEMFIKDRVDDAGNPLKVVYESSGPRWEVAVTVSEKGFQQMSFVNSIATTKGGRHVDYVTNMVVNHLTETLSKKNKSGVEIRPFQIKNHLWMFVNALIENPTFDSQTKENMTSQQKTFGSKCVLTEKFFTAVIKSGVVEAVMSWAKFKQQAALQKKCAGKKTNKLKGIPKLEDANDAGTRFSSECTLILTEGDSAKTLAVAGLGVVGRDRYGVFPLRGKVLNTREATVKQMMENAEINNIIQIVGLQYKKKYETQDDMKSLRYGKVMIMTDQDMDGSHIKGLLINFFHHNWPSLLRMDFLEEFITPIVKASKAKEEFSFYSLPEFEEWKAQKGNWHTYKIKYYKGLGTSTSKEAKEYFSDMRRHRITFEYAGSQDDHSITMAFSRKAIEQRKEWLTAWMQECKRRKELGLPEVYLYEKNTRSINYTDFVNKELILFSNADNERSIPCLVDGMKPGGRKVLFTCLKRNDKREVKVAQLAGSIAEHTAYHHGEVSLMSTIVNLAQNYVGSNNINILQPIGQFGTRLMGGKDSASPRYIFTKLSPLARFIFHPHDDALLKFLKDDNLSIEPEWYIPILPMVLVNGSEGIGTGWSSKVPNYDPRLIIDNLRKMIRKEEPKIMIPHYKNFRGTIEQVDTHRYLIHGEVSRLAHNQYEITELPVKTWTQVYKEGVLEPLLGTDKTPPIISDYREYNTDTTVKFKITLPENTVDQVEEEGPHKIFKLQTTMSTNTMVLFDANGLLRRYNSVMDILQEFFELRLVYYHKRKTFMVGMLQAEANRLSNQARFIREKCSGHLVVENKKRKVIITELQTKGYDSDPVKAWKKLQDREAAALEDGNEVDSDEEAVKQVDDGADFEYLLGMSMWCLTQERKEDLLKKEKEKLQELNILKEKSPEDLWNYDLNCLREELDRVEAQEAEDERLSMAGIAKKLAGAGTGAKRKKGSQGFVAMEVMPTRGAKRIVPHIDDDLKKKLEKASAAASSKSKKRKKDAEDEADEFDGILSNNTGKSLTARLGNSPDVIAKKARTKRAEAGVKGKSGGKMKGRNAWSSGSEEGGDGSSDGGASSGGEEAMAPRERANTGRRAAAATSKYKFSDAESDNCDDDDDNVSMHSNEGVDDDVVTHTTSGLDNTTDDIAPEEPPAKQPTVNKESKPKTSKASKKLVYVEESDDAIAIIDSDSDFDDVKPSKRSKPSASAAPISAVPASAAPASVAPVKNVPPEDQPSASDLFDFMITGEKSPPHSSDPTSPPASTTAPTSAPAPTSADGGSSDVKRGIYSDSDDSYVEEIKPVSASESTFKPEHKSKKAIILDSDSDEHDFGSSKNSKKKSGPKKTAAAKKKNLSDSDDHNDVAAADKPTSGRATTGRSTTGRATTGRSRKPVTYNVVESESDSDY